MDTLLAWIPAIIAVVSGLGSAYAIWRSARREDSIEGQAKKKADIEYWQGVSRDLTVRLNEMDTKLIGMEAKLNRYQLAFQFISAATGNNVSVLRTAQDIIDGKIEYKDTGD